MYSMICCGSAADKGHFRTVQCVRFATDGGRGILALQPSLRRRLCALRQNCSLARHRHVIHELQRLPRQIPVLAFVRLNQSCGNPAPRSQCVRPRIARRLADTEANQSIRRADTSNSSRLAASTLRRGRQGLCPHRIPRPARHNPRLPPRHGCRKRALSSLTFSRRGGAESGYGCSHESQRYHLDPSRARAFARLGAS
jgi:hypothetical protein